VRHSNVKTSTIIKSSELATRKKSVGGDYMREFLKGLELDKETIDTIMAEYGKNVQGLREQLDDYKSQVDNYKSQVTELNGKIEESTKSLENLQTLTDENKNLKADITLNGANVKKEFMKFVRSEVLSKVDDKTDLTKALDEYKKDNPQYFGDVQVKKVETSPSLNSGVSQQITTNNIMNDLIRNGKNS
jgi:chromosome segregation ATPase